MSKVGIKGSYIVDNNGSLFPCHVALNVRRTSDMVEKKPKNDLRLLRLQAQDVASDYDVSE